MAEKNVTIAGTTVHVRDFKGLNEKTIIDSFLNFIDVANTATDRATFYNKKEEQKDAVTAIHKTMISIDRGVYGASLLLNGVTDYTITTGIKNLLSVKEYREQSSIDLDTETKIVAFLLTQLPAPRMFKLYEDLKEKRTNNSRTRKVILMSILNSKSLDYWAVKYRKKIYDSLEHAWGKRTTSILKSILSKNPTEWNDKEKNIINTHIGKHVVSTTLSYVYECLAFILRAKTENFTIDTLKSFVEAKKDIAKGSKLPREVLEGIRGTYHKAIPTAQVLELTKQNLTAKEQMKVQNNAAVHGVKVDFDPTKQDAVDMYIHAYANGMTEPILAALKQKAKDAAAASPISYQKMGILIDASASSKGDITQKLRPLAIAQAIRDMLKEIAPETSIEYAGGKLQGHLVMPEGETNLAGPLVKLLKTNPEAIFIISDGYENAPSGRVNEVLHALKNLGITIPIFQITPVASAEAGGVKKLSTEISVVPANKPASIGLGMVKAMLEANLKDGIIGLFSITLPRLLKRKK